jgi:hypothetical protein
VLLYKFTELAEILPPILSPIRQPSVLKQVDICRPEEEKTGDVKGHCRALYKGDAQPLIYYVRASESFVTSTIDGGG